jgi:cold shock CspA family protein
VTESRRGSRHTGSVVAFDATVGLGVVQASTGERHTFHCIEIADGSRSIELGDTVTFDLLCKFGRYEAANIGP